VPNILSIGISTPGSPISQKSISDFMSIAHGITDPTEISRLQALYRASAIDTRYSVLDDYGRSSDFEFFPNNDELEPFPTVSERMELYNEHACILASAAIDNCISSCSSEIEDVTHLITVSCTGMQAPGLDIQLIKKLNFRSSVHRTAINYMGCYAALSALKVANDICLAHREANVMIICLELCSIHFQKEPTEDNMLANSLFGDGAAAALVGNSIEEQYISMDLFKTNLFPEGEDDMAWSIGNTGFEMRLSSYVPDIISFGIKDLVEVLYHEANVSQVDEFAIHPGGKKILDVVREELNLDKKDLEESYQVLKDYGNMSSPTILFVIHKLLYNESPRGRRKALALAFGPGLTVESAMMTIHNA